MTKIKKDYPQKMLKPENIIAMKKLGRSAISPDGKWVAFVQAVPVLEEDKSEYRNQIWLISTDKKELLQLTNGTNGDSSPEWSPDSKYIAFVSKRNSDKEQIWIIPITGGEARQLTYAKNGASTPRWSPDAKKIAFLMEEADSKLEKRRKKSKDDPISVGRDDFKQTHLWTIDVKTIDKEPEFLFTLPEEEPEDKNGRDKSHRLTDGDFHVNDPQWSPDAENILFISAPSPKADHIRFNSSIQIVNIDTGAIREATPIDSRDSMARWSRDGKQIAFLRPDKNAKSLQKDIHILPAEGGATVNLTSEFDHDEVAPIWSPDDKLIYFEVADKVRRHIYSVSIDDKKICQITHGDFSITGMSIADDGNKCLCRRETPEEPPDLYVGSLLNEGKLKQITKLNPQIAEFALGETRVIHWKSIDGLEIEGLLRLPVDYEDGKSYPLVVAPHGGPHGAVALEFRQDWHHFNSAGFAVFAPNFRGSDGYGQKFSEGNVGDWGGGDCQDVLTGVDYLVKQGIADPDRLVISGWSYGGYMTAWTITQTDRFKAACDGAGLINLVSMYAQNDIPTIMELYFGGKPVKELLELYRERSPISHIHQVKTPTLILHGAEDKRVPVPQAEEFYTGLTATGIETEFVKYPREGHGIEEPRHMLDMLKRRLAWFQKHISE